MAAISALLALMTTAQTVDKPTLELYQGFWVVRAADRVERVPLVLPTEAPTMAILFRRGNTFVVWDERGLSVRVDKKITSTRMPEIAVSPRVFPRDEIRENLKRFASGERKKEANALSGARRLGNEAYFLLRWDDRAGKPWLEALVAVDLSAEKPKPRLLGRFEGLTLATKAIDDRLFFLQDKPSAITRNADSWGRSTYVGGENPVEHLTLGDRLTDFRGLPGNRGLFVENTGYGTWVVGKADLLSGSREVLAESPRAIRLVDGMEPSLAIVTGEAGAALRNLDTAAEVPLPPSPGIRRAATGVIVWTPSGNPTSATLYDFRTWEKRAEWRKPATTPTSRPAGASGGSPGALRL